MSRIIQASFVNPSLVLFNQSFFFLLESLLIFLRQVAVIQCWEKKSMNIKIELRYRLRIDVWWMRNVGSSASSKWSICLVSSFSFVKSINARFHKVAVCLFRKGLDVISKTGERRFGESRSYSKFVLEMESIYEQNKRYHWEKISFTSPNRVFFLVAIVNS